MINAAIVGLGWWGKTLVESGEGSEAIRFTAGTTRTVTPEIEAFAKKNGLRLAADYASLLADPAIDAVVLATPHSMHSAQVIAAAAAVWKVTKGKWLWNIGGYEYCLFWAICCLIVAMHYYHAAV